MRLHLDSAVTQTDIRSNEVPPAPAGGSGYDSRRTGNTSADSIRISGPSSALASLASDRAARIQQLTAQVQGGTYNVSSSLIGQAIVGHAATWAGSES